MPEQSATKEVAHGGHRCRIPMVCSASSFVIQVADSYWTCCRDRRKLTFYFVAEKRIDFRELVRELFRYVVIDMGETVINFRRQIVQNANLDGIFARSSIRSITRHSTTKINGRQIAPNIVQDLILTTFFNAALRHFRCAISRYAPL